MSKKERKQTNLNRIGLFEKPLGATSQGDDIPTPHEIIKEEVISEEVVSEITKTPKSETSPQVTQNIEPRPMIRVGIEIYRDLDKKIELLVVEEGKKKRDVINELLELAFAKR